MKFSFGIPLAALLAAGFAMQAPKPVRIDKEPRHHVIFANGTLLVLKVMLPPGASTVYHTHPYDGVAIHLSQSWITHQMLNEAESAQAETKPGEVSVDVLKNGPYAHRVHNVGKTTFEVLDVLFPGSRGHSSPPSFDGPLVGETPEARVYRWVLAPGASCPMHTHMHPSFLVAAAEFTLRTEWPGKEPDSGPLNPGDYNWTGSEVTHRFVNEGKQEAQIIEIEMK